MASDFFNKVPMVILVPGVLLVSFLIAAFLIWAGMKMAPVYIREPIDPYESKSNSNSARPPSEEAGAGNSSQGENNGNSRYSFSDGNGSVSEQADGGTLSNSRRTGGGEENQLPATGQNNVPQGIDSSVSEVSNVNSNTADKSRNSSSSSSGEKESGDSGNSGFSSSAGESGAVKPNESTSGDCTYPEGDPKLWWSRATKKQRDCYVSKNGPPNFGKDMPYFCDYESNNDCYYK